MNQWILSLPLFVISTQLLAGNIEVVGTIPVQVSKEKLATKSGIREIPHYVSLQKIKLSDTAKYNLAQRAEAIKTHESQLKTMPSKLPESIKLGMNGTPVLNQGMHGSCVTFAVTGAIDAVIGKGNYISQLCSLELGDYLERHGEIPYSGWDGSIGPVVYGQLSTYGFITKRYQLNNGCAGVKRYPQNNPRNTGKPMSVDEYSKHSFPLNQFAAWESVLDPADAFNDASIPDNIISAVKRSLNKGNRLTFGVLLDVSQGEVGAIGSFATKNDTWMLNDAIIRNAKEGTIDAGHQMIITGYDDNAVVKDSEGNESKGIFYLRNSWGVRSGHRGTYFMTYDYFKLLTDEVQIVRKA